MRHFRKKSSSSGTPTDNPPPIAEYIRRGLATFNPRKKDRRALAASSSAVALSIISPSCDPTDSDLNEPGSSKESVWKAAYGAARIAVEIAKDSLDMFPPAKAVMVALSVLIKNCDQTIANTNQVREVEARIHSLSEILRYPVNEQDGEEKERREVFRRKLVGIVIKLGPLAEQHGFMKFLKNVDHANTLNGFVKELADAITDYQISLQQNIRENTRRIDETANRINNTANNIDETTQWIMVSTNRIDETTIRIDETTVKIDEATNRVDERTKRIDETANRIDNTTSNIDETAQRIAGTTNRIGETTFKIDEITTKVDETTVKIDETTVRIDEATVKIDEATDRIDERTKRLEEITKKIDQTIIDAADLEILGKLDSVRTAGYQAGHHDKCLPGTRESVLDEILRWAEDPQDRHVFWLNGLAGTGKSTIAQTFSEMVANAGILGASFFCSRDYLDRRELKNIFPTLAYQLACRYPAFRRHIIPAIKQDPTVASNSLISQLEDLIVRPLVSSNISCVIVVDALDECIDKEPASAILSVLGRHVKQLLSAKFFITGRPEPRIRTGFRLPLLEPLTQTFLLHEVKPSSVDGDIRLYLQEKLTAISKRRSDIDLPNPWPCNKDLTTLTKKSSGLFIFASTLVRFIESEHHEPNEQLQLIITSSNNTSHEGRAGIDLLYTQILANAFLDVEDTTLFPNVRRVLGAVVVAFNPLSRVQIAGILGVNTSLIARSLRHLHSVLLVPKEDSKEIRVFHKSFPDFLQDSDRCSDPRFFIDPLTHHGDIALDCLELMKKLKPNPCNLPDFVMNRDVANLPELLEENVGSATSYACGYWAMHIQSSQTTDEYANRLIPSATEFFENNAIPWIEVMSLDNRLESVIHSIYNLLEWLGVVNAPTSHLRSLADDCLRFTMHFFNAIQQSASHIYHSALPLSPDSSTFRSKALGKTRITGFHGRPNGWGIVLRTITAGSKRVVCMATFGHKIAAAYDDDTVGVYDSVTGVPQLSLNPAKHIRAIRGCPGGSILFCAHKKSITIWDIQTGGLIHTFILDRKVEVIAVSLGSRYLACGFSGGSVEVLEVANKMEDSAVWTYSPATRFCWLEPEERLVVSAGALVSVWDIVAGTVLHNFTIPFPIHHVVYSWKFNLLATVATSESESRHMVTIINPQTATTAITYHTQEDLTCIACSQTAEELVCGKKTGGLQLFNISKWGRRYIEHPVTVTSISPLPNGTVAAHFKGSGIQLLSLDGEHAESQQSPTASALPLYSLAHGEVIAVLKAGRIALLRVSTMEPLAIQIPIQKTHPTAHNRARVFCSLSRFTSMAVYSFNENQEEYMQLLESNRQHPKWTVRTGGLPSIGGISPSGTRIVTFTDVGNQTFVCARDARSGELEATLRIDPIHPLDITFDSDTRFYSHHDTHRVPYDVVIPVALPDRDDTLPLWFRPTVIRCQIVRCKPLSLIDNLSQGRYDVDDTHEWVVSDSKRICWIPPGYIGSVQPSYCWVGSSLFMAGQDGTLRKLTFQQTF